MNYFVVTGKDQHNSVEGYGVNKTEIQIIDYKKTVCWHGQISDVGSFDEGDYQNGEVFPFDGHRSFSSGKELADHFNLSISELVFGKEPKSERPLKKCPICGANHFFATSEKDYEATVDEKGNLVLSPEGEKINRVNCSNCGKQFDIDEDFKEIKGW